MDVAKVSKWNKDGVPRATSDVVLESSFKGAGSRSEGNYRMRICTPTRFCTTCPEQSSMADIVMSVSH